MTLGVKVVEVEERGRGGGGVGVDVGALWAATETGVDRLRDLSLCFFLSFSVKSSQSAMNLLIYVFWEKKTGVDLCRVSSISASLASESPKSRGQSRGQSSDVITFVIFEGVVILFFVRVPIAALLVVRALPQRLAASLPGRYFLSPLQGNHAVHCSQAI